MELISQVFPSENPLLGLSDMERAVRILQIAQKVEALLTSEQGLRATRVDNQGVWRYSVDPSVVTEVTGAEFPVSTIEILFSRTGDPLPIPIFGEDADETVESPIAVSFGECFFFDEGAQFFQNLARAFGSSRVIFGSTPM